MLTTKRTDNYDSITWQCENEDGSRVDLTGATAQFIMGKKNKLITNAPAQITSAADGIVEYKLTNSDTLVAGTFLGEFEITFPTGEKKTFPSNGYITVAIGDNLDNGQVNIVLDMIAAKQGDFEAKLSAILAQAGNVNMSSIDEYTWTTIANQVSYTFPTTSSYTRSAKWFKVYVGGIPVDDSLINRAFDTKFELFIDPTLIKEGTKVTAQWMQPMAAIAPTSYKVIPQQSSPPVDAVEGDMWFDTSDNTYQGTIFDNLNATVTSVNTQILALFKQPRDRTSSETDDSNRVQELFTGKGRLYFPDGTYTISRQITIYDDTEVICHPNATFKLGNNAKCRMFVSDTISGKKNFKWLGGIIDGNDANQGDETTYGANHDISRAFVFFNFFKVELGNVKIKNIMGHAVGHWGNEHAHFHDIEFRQGTAAGWVNGGSRRDGISGVSKNMIFDKITGFTDDDFIAICPGCTWDGNVTTPSVENVFIRNINFQSNDIVTDQNVWRGIAVYCGASGSKVKNMYVDGVYGVVNIGFMRIFGIIDKFVLANTHIKLSTKGTSGYESVFWLDSSKMNSGGSYITNGLISDMTFENCRFELQDSDAIVSPIRLTVGAVINKLKIDNVDVYSAYTGASTKSFIELDNNSVIDSIDSNKVNFELATANVFPFIKRIESSAEVSEAVYTGSSGSINSTFVVNRIQDLNRFMSVKLGYGTANPNGSVKITSLSVILQGDATNTNLVPLSSLATSGSISVTQNGDGSVTLTVTDPNHLYPNIPVNNLTWSIGTYNIKATYVKLAGNSELILEPRYIENVVDKSASTTNIVGSVSKKNITTGTDVIRSSSKDRYYNVDSKNLIVDTASIVKTLYNRFIDSSSNIIEYNSGNKLMTKKFTVTVEKSGFTLNSNSSVWRQGNIIYGTILLDAVVANQGSWAQGDFLASFNYQIPYINGTRYDFSGVVLGSSGGVGVRTNEFFEFQYDQTGKTVIKASTAVSNIRWVTLVFAHHLNEV